MSDTYALPSREVPVLERADVVVVGGGFAGVCAAAAATRLGARVVLIERDGMLGGQAAEIYAFGLDGVVDADGNQFLRGLPWEIIQRTVAEGQSDPLWSSLDLAQLGRDGVEASMAALGVGPSCTAYQYLNPNAFRYVLHAIAEEEGICTYLETPLVGVMREGDRILGVVAQGNYGPFALAGAVVVDTTPHAGVGAMAGKPFAFPEAYTGTHPRLAGVEIDPLLEFACSGEGDVTVQGVREQALAGLRELVNRQFPLWFKGFRPVRDRAAAVNPEYGQLGYGDPPYLMFFYDRDGCGSLWVHSNDWSRTRLDDPRQLSRALSAMRRQQWLTHRLFRDHVPGFAHAHFMDVHPHIARALTISREPGGYSDYDLPWQAIEEGWSFPDSVARIMGHPDKGQCRRGFQLPYRCLLPGGLEGLLVTGKPACRFIHYHTTVAAVGQAAGVAAGLASRSGATPRELPVEAIQAELARQGATVF